MTFEFTELSPAKRKKNLADVIKNNAKRFVCVVTRFIVILLQAM